MLRMALRGLFARKLRTALTGVRRGHRRRVRVGHVHLHRHDQRLVHRPVRARRRRASTSTSPPSRPVEGDFGGRIQPLPAGHAREGPGRRRRRGRRGRLETAGLDLRRGAASAIGGNGPPSIVFSTDEERFDPLDLRRGRAARTSPARSRSTRRPPTTSGFKVGDEILDRRPRARRRSYELVGITKLGDQKSLGIESMTMPLVRGAADRATSRAAITEVVVAAEDGTSPEQLKAADLAGARRHRRGPDGQGAGREGRRPTSPTRSASSRSRCSSSPAIAVFVGGFLIFNTFAVTVAQRSREFALLRTLGASRRQVLNSVVVETLVIGFLASVVGHPRRPPARAGAARRCSPRSGIELPSTGHRDRGADDHRRRSPSA